MFFWVTYGLLWILVASMICGMLVLFRIQGKALISGGENRDRQGPPTGTRVKHLAMRQPSGETIDLGRPSDERGQLVFFASPQCQSCRDSRDTLNTFAEAHQRAVETVVICNGEVEQAREFAAPLSQSVHFIVDERLDVASHWRVRTAPFIILLDATGHVSTKKTIMGLNELVDFANRIESQRIARGSSGEPISTLAHQEGYNV